MMKDLKKLLVYIKPYKISIIIVSLMSIIYSCLFVISPKILALATNRLVDKKIIKITNLDIKYIVNILIICALIYILTSIIEYVNSLIINRICNKLSYNLRKDISKKINSLPLKYYDQNEYGEIISRIGEDVDNISSNLEQILSSMISDIICFIGILIMMFSISKIMSIITLILIPVQMFIMIIIMFKTQKYFNVKKDIISNMDSKIISSITSHKLIEVNNKQEEDIKDFEKINDNLYNCGFKSDFYSSIILPIVSLVNNLSYIIISIVGGYSVVKNRLKVGDIQAFLQYIQSFNNTSEELSSMSSTLQSVYASIKHINIFLEQVDEVDYGIYKPKKLIGNIEFKNVYFSYDNKKNVIKNFNVKIKSGSKIAIVGETGCGKTTISNLLMKFYDGYTGEILIDGKDIKDISTDTLRSKFGIVLQNSFVMNDTVLNNINFLNNKNSNKLDILEKEFNLKDYINYDLLINEDNDNISLGEQQIISIFRTIINEYDIVILDEATSNIDSRTEELIQKLTNKVMEDKTSIIIAHRLSTIKNADYILVMDKGKLVGVGKHDELINSNNKYKKIYENSI